MKTLEMIENILKNNKLMYQTEINGVLNIAYCNENGGISVNKGKGKGESKNLIMSGEMLKIDWEPHNKRYTFMEAINSGKRIKPESWANFRPIPEALYDLLDYQDTKVIELMNGYWNIEEYK